ncbi:MAG: hypothetical protein QOJ99_1169 [Bryobacterales bacterium]|nr:hypothetical protein [Bryobacterales bacterium]
MNRPPRQPPDSPDSPGESGGTAPGRVLPPVHHEVLPGHHCISQFAFREEMRDFIQIEKLHAISQLRKRCGDTASRSDRMRPSASPASNVILQGLPAVRAPVSRSPGPVHPASPASADNPCRSPQRHGPHIDRTRPRRPRPAGSPAAQKFKAITAGHLNIQKDGIRRGLVHLRQRFFRIGGRARHFHPTGSPPAFASGASVPAFHRQSTRP